MLLLLNVSPLSAHGEEKAEEKKRLKELTLGFEFQIVQAPDIDKRFSRIYD